MASAEDTPTEAPTEAPRDPLAPLREAQMAGPLERARAALARRWPGATVAHGWMVAVGAGVVLLVTVGVAAFALGASRRAPPASETTGPADASAPTAEGSSGSAADPGSGAPAGDAGPRRELVVQVAGAVVHPGVFHLPAGARLGDLVARAGGLTPDADADRVDLAGPLTDGVLVRIPRRGEPAPAGAVVGDPGGDAGGGAAPGAPVDLNTATLAQLDALPGVGPTTAAAIVAYRHDHGPFRRVDDLAQVRGIGPAKLSQLRPLVSV